MDGKSIDRDQTRVSRLGRFFISNRYLEINGETRLFILKQKQKQK